MRGGMAILVMALAVAAHGLAGGTQKGKTPLEGTWQVTSLFKDGKEMQADEARKIKTIIHGNKYTIRSADEVLETGTFKIDSQTKPTQVTFTLTSGPDKGKSFHGIFEIKEHRLKALVVPSDQPRPTTFTASKGTRLMLAERDKSANTP
jgi:uncharacterized protein (TIGR03067 family)